MKTEPYRDLSTRARHSAYSEADKGTERRWKGGRLIRRIFRSCRRGRWKDAVRGKFYRPVKKAVSLRLDADVIAWLKKDGKGYQTRANRVLREKMLKEMAG